MDRMKRIMVLTVSIMAVAILASASSWEGSAMMGSYGDFPPGGYFAACNSFPRNTAVEVTNLETGKSVTVIIVRGLDNPGIFMMVSAEAAEALGLRQGKIARVRAVEPRSVAALAPSAGSRKALDADFNPRLLAAEELKRMGYDLVESPVTPVVDPSPEAAPAPVLAEAIPEVPEAGPATDPGTTDSTPVVIAPLHTPPVAERPGLVQDLVRPEPAVIATDLVPVPTPEAPRLTVDEKPDAINGGKPKPIRTVVLPELPEPEAFPALAVIEPLVDEADTGTAVPEGAKPEILSMTLPVPDETPIRVNPAPEPRRFEAPAALPDVLDRSRTAQLAPEMVELTLAEPALEAALVSGSTDRAVALERMAPARRNGFALTALDWPELEADEIPDVVLARLTEPAQMIPPTSLAEGEIIFQHDETPKAVALETPSFAAAETRIALASPEVEPVAQAELHGPMATDVPVPVQTAPTMAMESPVLDDESPVLDDALPGEVIVVLEPTDLRPPVLDAPVVMEAPEVAETPVVKAPDPVVKAPDPVRPEPAVSPVRPAMAIGALERGRHYIQVGAYRTEAAAAETVSVLRMDYVIVLERSAGSSSQIWKIFVGPMGRDESGMALLRVRSLGFKDAFLKVGG